MAQISSLPVSPVSFLFDLQYPFIQPMWVIDASAATMLNTLQDGNIGEFVARFDAGSNVPGAGVSDFFSNQKGQVGRRFNTIGPALPQQAVYGFAPWNTGDPLGFAPGYVNPANQRVIIWDIEWLTDVAAGAPFTAATGFALAIYAGTNYTTGDGFPGTAAQNQLFGIFGRSDGGNQAWNYASHAQGGALLESINILPAVIPDVQDWTSARFTFVASGPGREAVLSLEVNRVPIFADEPFGTAALPRLQTAAPTAYTMVLLARVGNATGDNLTWRCRCRSGDNLLDGSKVLF